MDELPAGKSEEDEQGEGDQEGQSGHAPPTHQSCVRLHLRKIELTHGVHGGHGSPPKKHDMLSLTFNFCCVGRISLG